ncbi:hypothetical protein [Halorarius halobius]|uniref:hypothetical protein n=1 Tax=Halorarius halobius TaxID=2962671 RepID=UPI0020CFE148|nr:hypothetical protein [Halorarius halobius]
MQFRAPNRLIDRADALAAVLGEDRTDVLVTALREYLQDAAHDDALTQEIAAAYLLGTAVVLSKPPSRYPARTTTRNIIP